MCEDAQTVCRRSSEAVLVAILSSSLAAKVVRRVLLNIRSSKINIKTLTRYYAIYMFLILTMEIDSENA